MKKPTDDTKQNVVELKQPPPQEKTGFTVDQAIRLNRLLSIVTNQSGLTTKAHYWAVYHLGKIKPIFKAYQDALKSHADHAAYVAEINSGKSPTEVDPKFPKFVEANREIISEPCDLSVRFFKAEWLIDCAPSGPLGNLLVEFDLIDDPEKLLELICADDEKGDSK